MEYCGAGSVSDIIRLRNKTVSCFFKYIYSSLQNQLVKLELQDKILADANRPICALAPRKQAHAVADCLCAFLRGVVTSRSKCILKYKDLGNFLKITPL